jgi:hypothetical protein
MAVDPITGKIFIDFYDRRADAANYLTRLSIARSSDEGRTFQNFALTTDAFNPAGAFLGDYTWLDAYDNRVAVAWTETTANASRTNRETIVKAGSADFH